MVLKVKKEIQVTKVTLENKDLKDRKETWVKLGHAVNKVFQGHLDEMESMDSKDLAENEVKWDQEDLKEKEV